MSRCPARNPTTIRSRSIPDGPGRLGRSLLLVACVLALHGCVTVGPQSIAAGRGAYVEVINQTENEQILNALVRLRYDETFGLMSVASVTASMRFATQAGLEVGFGDNVDFAGNLVPFSAGLAYEENPTISYVPLSGEEFMRRMLSPITVDEWVLMSEPVKQKGFLLDLAVRRINGVLNPLPGEGTRSPEFARIAQLYGELRDAAVLDVVRSRAPENGAVNFWQFHDYRDGHADAVREMLDLLGIDANVDDPPVVLPVYEAVGRSSSAINVQTRSLYDLLRIFGTGIEIPEDHLDAGVVEPLSSDAWERFPLLNVRTSEDLPDDAIVRIRFRDRWFYINAADTRSKRAFLFLRTFIGVRLADPAATQKGPVLTVPVN